MSAQDNGGPAFPTSDPNYETKYAGEGMSQRDYFAAKAMQGICAQSDTWGLTVDEIASQSYAMADEMMKARQS